MSLRWRLSLALAALAALATITTASIAYASTSQRIDGEIDRFLSERLDAVLQSKPHWPMDVAGKRPGPGYDHWLPVDAELQWLNADGTVVGRVGGVDLPVDHIDRALAAARVDPADLGEASDPTTDRGQPADTRYRTAFIAGRAYRIATRPVSRIGAVQAARELSERERVLGALRWRFTMVGTLVVAGAAGLGFLIARRGTRDLERLTATAEHVASTGRLDVAIDVTRNDETGRLARAQATMLDALARSRQQQRDLVQDASHELRTPITSLRTNIDVLSRHPELPEAQRAAIVGELRLELGELATLLDELVSTAGDTGDSQDAVAVNLMDVVRHTAQRVARRHDRTIVVSGQGAVVVAPPVALSRAVSNLLENAVKFSPDHTPVAAVVDGGRLEVCDDGPGVKAEEASRVFDRFFRSATARTLPGSGLGLAIVRQVVEAADGRVFVRPGGESGARAAIGFDLPVLVDDVAGAPGQRPVRVSSTGVNAANHTSPILAAPLADGCSRSARLSAASFQPASSESNIGT